MKQIFPKGAVIILSLFFFFSCKSSSDSTDALVEINVGLIQEREKTIRKNQSMMNMFSELTLTNPKNPKFKGLYDKALTVMQKVDDFDWFIQSLKIGIIAYTDEIDVDDAKKVVEKPGQVRPKTNTRGPAEFLNPNNSKNDVGNKEDLKDKLSLYKKFLLSVMSDSKGPRRKEVEECLQILDLKLPEHLPQSGILAELTRWQCVAQESAFEILTFIHDQRSETSFRFDNIKAAIVPSSTVIETGSTFEAEVFIQAYSYYVVPQIIYGTDVDTITGKVTNGIDLDPKLFTSDGRAHIKIPAGVVGEKKCEGIVRIVHPATGEITNYPFSTKYQVISKRK